VGRYNGLVKPKDIEVSDDEADDGRERWATAAQLDTPLLNGHRGSEAA